MVEFALAVFFLIITPGPGVMTTAGVGSGFGFAAGARYVLGLCIGNNAVGLAVVTGLAALVLADDRIRFILFTASIIYLFYLALRIALAGAKIAFVEKASPPGITGGLMLQAINPKAYSVNLTFFSGFAFWSDWPLGEVMLKFLIMNLIWIPIHFAWLWAGVSLHRLNLSHRAQRAINIAMALSMLAVVGIAAWSAR